MLNDLIATPVAIALQSWLDTHAGPFLLIDGELRILAVNQAYEMAYGLTSASLVGRHCYEAHHHRRVPCFEAGEECPYQQAAATGHPHTCLHTHYDGDGEPRWVRVRIHPLHGLDGQLYFGETVEELVPAGTDGVCGKGGRRMVGRSPTFLAMVDTLSAAAQAVGPVLLGGETGTGKELAAAFLHHHSSRAGGPFQCLDCAAVPADLFESEVFGHERGSFTSSAGRRKGLFELADGGTLFLDEVGEMPLAMQGKLLRVLESPEFRRVGGERSLRVDVRIVCATNRPLLDWVQVGRFREDLYHRIACFCVELPPLRERLEDLPLIVAEILRHLPASPGAHRHRISRDAVDCLRKYRFPGNVRELGNILQVAASRARGGRIGRQEVARVLRDKEAAQGRVATRTHGSQAHGFRGDGPSTHGVPSLAEVERDHLAKILARHGGHRRDTARAMGISERTLYRKLRKLDLG